MSTERSARLLDAYAEVVPGGVHSNFRTPLYFEKAAGARLWDVDGNEYIDCTVSNGACILGHGDPDVEREVIAACRRGLTVGMESELSLRVAERLKRMIPSAERVRFANTGTEAVMKALMIARGASGREKLIKMEGAYHGWFDEAQVSVHPALDVAGPPGSPTPVLETHGVRANTLDTVLVVPFNDTEALDRVLSEEADDVAAVILEPVIFNSGCILPRPGYLEEVRRLTRKHDVLLIFDEIITGFRLAPGGAQERFGVKPDLSVFAKAIANGYPLSAVVGRKDLLEITRPGGTVLYGGTYNGQHIALAAASACLEKLADGSPQRRLQEATTRLKNGFDRNAVAQGIDAQLLECGGQFQVYFTSQEIVDYRTASTTNAAQYLQFHAAVHESGIWMKASPLFHHGVTCAHTNSDLDRVTAAFDAGLARAKEVAV